MSLTALQSQPVQNVMGFRPKHRLSGSILLFKDASTTENTLVYTSRGNRGSDLLFPGCSMRFLHFHFFFLLQLTEEDVVFDIGCGDGRFLVSYTYHLCYSFCLHRLNARKDPQPRQSVWRSTRKERTKLEGKSRKKALQIASRSGKKTPSLPTYAKRQVNLTLLFKLHFYML